MSRTISPFKSQVNEWDIAKKIVEQNYLAEQAKKSSEGASYTLESRNNKIIGNKGMPTLSKLTLDHHVILL